MNRLFVLIITLFTICIFINCDKTNVVDDPTQIEIISFEKLFELPEIVNESSGLILCNDQIITHNDSGDTTNLYLIDPVNGLLHETKTIEQINHQDWEAITQNETSIFIGDFGNNAGNRTDLKIYQIDKTTFEPTDTIQFAYAKQVNFDPDHEQHNFNMEAMIWMEDQLYLFSKNHLNLKTYLYQLNPLVDSMQLLSPIDSSNVNGLVTDAAYWEAIQRLALIGYDNSQNLNTFLYLSDDFNSTNLLKGRSIGFNLDINEQIEGCTFIDEETIWITSEKETNFGGNVYELILD